ncbi:MAG: pilin [Candidatus Shapirobacteria bacterium]|nr:pilin [Candidatus Shapirobacteria bacterium]
MLNPLNIFIPKSVLAQTDWNGNCVGTGEFSDVATIKGFECLFANILQIITTIAGLAFFAMFIIGGFKYLTSGGDPKKTEAASSTLTMSIIGLVGVIISWLILLFIKNFTGVDVTQFKVGN